MDAAAAITAATSVKDGEALLLANLRLELHRVESHLSGSGAPFLLGTSPSLGDFLLLPFIDRFRYVLAAYKGFHLLDEAPALTRMMHAAELLPSFQRTARSCAEYIHAFEYVVVPPAANSAAGDLQQPQPHHHKKSAISAGYLLDFAHVELFTTTRAVNPWSDVVRLTAFLKHVPIAERPMSEFRATPAPAAAAAAAAANAGDAAQQAHEHAAVDFILRHAGSGLRPVQSPVVACNYLVDSYRVDIDGGAASDDGAAACDHLHTESLRPDSQLDRAHERFLLNYLEKHFTPRVQEWRRRQQQQEQTSRKEENEEFERAASELRSAIAFVENELRNVAGSSAAPFGLGTANICLVDVALCGLLSRVDPALLRGQPKISTAMTAIKAHVEKLLISAGAADLQSRLFAH